jgi:hypothetical protein
MINKKRVITSFAFLLLGLITVFSTLAPPKAEASFDSLCGGFSRLNRAGCHGYFKGTNYYGTYGIQGQNIIDCTKAPTTCASGESVGNAIPTTINSANEFIAWVQKYLFNTAGTSYNYNKAGAAFIVDGMLGRYGTDYGTTAAGISYAQANFARWSEIVRYYEASGRITWNTAMTLPVGYVNSMHACWPSVSSCTTGNITSYDSQDFAFFKNNEAEPSHIITFLNPDGDNFQIRRECANLVGQIAGLTAPNFNLTPTVSATVNGAAAAAAEPGDTVKFTYTVNNSGSMSSQNTACNTYANVHTGYYSSPASPPAGGPAGPNPGCPRDFATGTTTVATEQFVIGAGNQTICRSLFVDPATYTTGAKGDETCVIVANKPYLRTFGGDISAGSGLRTGGSCTATNNTNAAITSWNKRAAGSYAGAGVQYAAIAMATITDFSTALGNAGGAAEPSGLAFANTSNNVAAGNFGGNFDAAPCIEDYYSRKPSTTSAMPANVSSMFSGAYSATGSVTLNAGAVNPTQRISLYVDGNLYINGAANSSISYTGTWDKDHMPLLEIVVRGNIYISGNISRLDGVYIAQKNGASGGTIYTCASGFAAPTLTNGAFFDACNRQLSVNGAFIANSVEFLRTSGSLGNSSNGETSDADGNGSNAGEVFNFNPTLWMVQPPESSGSVDKYDAITSLPPVL